jgi:hypothetical protein
MADTAHIHDDDLELYSAGHLEPERIPPLKAHLSICQDCEERLYHCVGPQVGDAAVPRLGRPMKRFSSELNRYCPKCFSSNIRRSGNGSPFAGVMRIFGRRPFRCKSCRSRFYLATERQTDSPPPMLKAQS